MGKPDERGRVAALAWLDAWKREVEANPKLAIAEFAARHGLDAQAVSKALTRARHFGDPRAIFNTRGAGISRGQQDRHPVLADESPMIAVLTKRCPRWPACPSAAHQWLIDRRCPGGSPR